MASPELKSMDLARACASSKLRFFFVAAEEFGEVVDISFPISFDSRSYSSRAAAALARSASTSLDMNSCDDDGQRGWIMRRLVWEDGTLNPLADARRDTPMAVMAILDVMV